MNSKRLGSSAANLEHSPWLVSRGVVALHVIVSYELSVCSLDNHRQGREQVEAKISSSRRARPGRGVQRELIDELNCLVTQAAVRLENEGRELDAEGGHYGTILRNLRLFSGRGSAEGARGCSCDERRGTRVCATHINRLHP